MTTSRKNIIIRIIDLAWSIFLNGLFTLLPLTLTIALFMFSLKILKGWLEPIYRLEPKSLQAIPHSEILLVIAVIFLFGIILRVFLFHSLIMAVEALLSKIPLIRPIYSGIKQLVHAFSFQDKMSFKRVVAVEFPRPGIYSVGFLTSEMPHDIAPSSIERYFNIFIPTTPNPTSGFFIVVPENQIKDINLTRQEAMALIISGGIILPERFSPKDGV